ncbi:MAG: hypothetical protein ACPGU1_11600 [Myxococcota bacterium]
MTIHPAVPPHALAHAAERGLDIAVPCVAQRYNASIADHPHLRPVETFGYPTTCAILIGNTRLLWPALKRAVAEAPTRLASDPVDRHVEATIGALQEAIPARSKVYFGHVMGDSMVSMVHAAEASGFADRGPAHLAVHPVYGPWFAIRALLVIDHPAVDEPPSSPELCASCSAPCVHALTEAMRLTESADIATGLGPNWRAWLAIRDACPVGQGARYSDGQIRYHYALDDSKLRPPRVDDSA